MKLLLLLSTITFNIVNAFEELHTLWNLSAAFYTIHDEVKSQTKTTTQKINTRNSELSIIMQPTLNSQNKKDNTGKDKPSPMSIHHNN
jgi:hypothetical protein